MKPIEEGCIAVVFQSYHKENIGKVVQVGEYVGKVFVKLDAKTFGTMQNQWKVSQDMACGPNKDRPEVYAPYQPAKNLRRIDDGDSFEKMIERENDLETNQTNLTCF